jgi:hypothetical protein
MWFLSYRAVLGSSYWENLIFQSTLLLNRSENHVGIAKSGEETHCSGFVEKSWTEDGMAEKIYVSYEESVD